MTEMGIVDIKYFSPIGAILVSLLACPFIILFGNKRPNLREAVSVVAGIIKFLFVISLYPVVLEMGYYYIEILSIASGISIKLLVDPMGLIFALGASFLWILTTFYSIGYMRGTHSQMQTRYFVCFALSLSATIGVAFAGNLLTLLIFYELMTIATYPLVVHKEDEGSLESGRKYMFYLLGAAKLCLIPAMAITYYVAGTMDYQPKGIFSLDQLNTYSSVLKVALIMYLYGYAKCAIMPLHSWLPSAMVAPTPVSALLHAVAVVKTGAFSIARILLNIYGKTGILALGIQDVILFLAGFTIIMGSLIALTRDDFKARLAFSTVSQLSYIVFGVALMHPLSVLGGILHITAHAFSKITLFFCAGSVYVSTHYTKISQLDGLAKKLPITFFSFFLATLSMVGVPGFIGFWSKFNIIIGCIQNNFILGALVFLTSSLLNVAYLLPIPLRALKQVEVKEDFYENYFCAIPLLITSLFTIFIALFLIEYLIPLLNLIEELYVK